MTEEYGEYSVRRADNTVTIRNRIIAAVLAVVGIIAIGFLPITFVTIGMLIYIMAILPCCYLLVKKSITEYDYMYMDNTFEVDKVINLKKRKKFARIHMENVKLIAPYPSPRFEGKMQSGNVKIKNCSSRDKEKQCFAMFVEKGEDKILLVFEPNTAILNMLERLNKGVFYKD